MLCYLYLWLNNWIALCTLRFYGALHIVSTLHTVCGHFERGNLSLCLLWQAWDDNCSRGKLNLSLPNYPEKATIGEILDNRNSQGFKTLGFWIGQERGEEGIGILIKLCRYLSRVWFLWESRQLIHVFQFNLQLVVEQQSVLSFELNFCVNLVNVPFFFLLWETLQQSLMHQLTMWW